MRVFVTDEVFDFHLIKKNIVQEIVSFIYLNRKPPIILYYNKYDYLKKKFYLFVCFYIESPNITKFCFESVP